MSYKTQAQAQARGEQVVKMMKKGTWEINVHENLGWFVSIKWEYFSISCYSSNYGSCPFMLLVGYGGNGISDIGAFHGNDPNELVQEAIKKVPEVLKYYTDVSDFIKLIS